MAFILFLLANNVDPDQTPHNVASELGLRCMYGFPGKNGLNINVKCLITRIFVDRFQIVS